MDKEYKLRHPIVSGLFYPDRSDELRGDIESNLKKIDRGHLYNSIAEQTKLKGPAKAKPLVLITPHAGFIFSGFLQAHSYALLESFKIDTVIIIGPAHQASFKGISINLDNAYQTPLGEINVDLDFSSRLIQYDRVFQHHEDAHLGEHSIEVQLPYIQQILPDTKIVPILFGEQSWDYSSLLKNALVSLLKDRQKSHVIVASTDLSHYHSHVDAQAMDNKIIEDIRKLDPDSFYGHIHDGKAEACGWGGILTGMLLVKEIGSRKSAILRYMDSGEVSGDRRKVVGYLSAALY
jgi:AmmeMemoRadiSam system protein B